MLKMQFCFGHIESIIKILCKCVNTLKLYGCAGVCSACSTQVQWVSIRTLIVSTKSKYKEHTHSKLLIIINRFSSELYRKSYNKICSLSVSTMRGGRVVCTHLVVDSIQFLTFCLFCLLLPNRIAIN